jgi:hypothetical protein
LRFLTVKAEENRHQTVRLSLVGSPARFPLLNHHLSLILDAGTHKTVPGKNNVAMQKS